MKDKGPELNVIRGGDDFREWTEIHRDALIHAIYGIIAEAKGGRSHNVVFLSTRRESRLPAQPPGFLHRVLDVAKPITPVEAMEKFPVIFKAIFEGKRLQSFLEDEGKLYLIVVHRPRPGELDANCIEVPLGDDDYSYAPAKTVWHWKLELMEETKNDINDSLSPSEILRFKPSH